MPSTTSSQLDAEGYPSHHVPEPKLMNIDGREYRATIFGGNGKHYDQLATDDPLLPRRMGTFLLHPICPIMDIVREHKRKVAIIEQSVEIRPITEIVQHTGELVLTQ